ncbi:MAG: hypothetical protein AUJ52_06045 [Elusimicrobia bacterium CG1_02_63_36]|nr:MAG: hypothetical protein AUJ52_06045 [Elusimicrobia bacterium CG1_02_63_36]
MLRHRDYKALFRPARFDLFDLLDKAIVENSWSAVLAFLCDSMENHRLGIDFFKEWQAAIENESRPQGGHGFRIPRRGISSIRAKFQWSAQPWSPRIIDIVIELRGALGDPLCVLGIENKLDAPEQKDQLEAYQTVLTKAYPSSCRKAVLYLTPDGREAKTASGEKHCPCIPISYETVAVACRKVAGKTTGALRVLLTSMDRHISKEDSRMGLKGHVKKLLASEEHKLALQAIVKHTPFLRKELDWFQEEIIHVRKKRKYPKGHITFDTYPHDAPNPSEIKVWFDELDELAMKTRGFFIGFIVGTDDPEPVIGSEYSLRVVAWCGNDKAVKQRAKKFAEALHDGTPEFPWRRRWVQFEPLWYGGRQYRLKDLGKHDARELARVVNDGIKEKYQELKKCARKSSFIKPPSAQRRR